MGVDGQAPPASTPEDVYRLTELQEAVLLFDRRTGDRNEGVVSLRGVLAGALDAEVLAAAWQATIDEHPELRRSVHWRDLPHPVQVVAPRAELPWTAEDWRGEPGEARRRLERLAARARRDGLRLERPPVMSWFMARTAELEHCFLWTCHHLLLDGWSSGLVLDEVLARYDSAVRGVSYAGSVSRSFREYVTWSRSAEQAGGALRLAGDVRPLCGTSWQAGARLDGLVEHRLEALGQSELEAWAGRREVTAATVMLACWALTVAEATDAPTATFGVTTSGRAIDFEGVESMLGMFANALPLQVDVTPDGGLDSWLREVQRRRQALTEIEHRPLAQLLRDSGYAWRRPPFDSLITYANFPVREAGQGARARGLRLTDLRGEVTSAYPLTLAITPGATLRIDAYYDSRALDGAAVEALSERFAAILETAVSASPDAIDRLLRDASGDLVRDTRYVRPTLENPGVSAADARQRGPLGTGARGAIEQQMVRIWNDLITVQEFGIDDNFFDLGGHSLLVPQLLARIRQDFGVELALGAVFAAPTVRAMAAAIAAREPASSWDSLVPIRKSGSRRPLFLVHGLGGEIGWFYNLANHLDPDMPLFGLQAPSEPFDELEPMAESYVSAVQAQQPAGPYRVGGYCVGGGVAFEMARRLRAAGETVEQVVLIDSVPQSHVVEQQSRSAAGLAARIRRFLGKDGRHMAESIQAAGKRALSRWRRRARAVTESAVELDDVLDMTTLPRVYHEASRRHFRAMRDYRPRRLDADVTLLRTADERFGEDFGWGPLVGGELVVERIAGRHEEVLDEPHVAGVGETLVRVLEELDRR